MAIWASATAIKDSTWNIVGGNLASKVAGQTISVPGLGTNSEQYGATASAYGDYSVVVGNGSNAAYQSTVIGQGIVCGGNSNFIGGYGCYDNSNSYCVIVGPQSYANGSYSTSIGQQTYAGNYGVTVGQGSSSSDYSIVLGSNAHAGSSYNFVAGYNGSDNSYSNVVSIGYSNATNGNDSINIGYNAQSGYTSVCIGSQAHSYDQAVGIGYNVYATYSSVAVGYQCYAYQSGNVVIGYQISDNSYSDIINIGSGNNINGSGSVIVAKNGTIGQWCALVGFNSSAGNYSAVLGSYCSASNNAVTIGESSSSSSYGVSIGQSTNDSGGGAQNTMVGANCSITSGSNSSLYGYNNTTADVYNVLVGSDNQITSGSYDAIAIGQFCQIISSSPAAIAIGDAVTIGYGSAPSTGAIGIGGGSITVSGTYAVSIGYNSGVSSSIGTALGYNAHVGAINGTALGAGATIGNSCDYCVAVGVSAAIGNATTYATIIGYLSGIGSGAVAHYSTAIGAAHQVGHVSCLVIGYGLATTATQQCIIGNAANQIIDFVFGTNPSASTVSDVTFRIPAKTGSNVVGKNTTWDAGNGTGAGGSGSFIWRVAPAAASSSTTNVLATAMTLDNTSALLLVGKVSKYNNISTVTNGLASLYATSDLTAQSAAIAATTIYAAPSAGAGLYRVSYVATVTTAATTSSILGGTNGFQIKFTDSTDSVVKTSSNAAVVSNLNVTTATISGVLIAKCKASTNLQYLFDYTSVGLTAMVYDLSIRVEAI